MCTSAAPCTAHSGRGEIVNADGTYPCGGLKISQMHQPQRSCGTAAACMATGLVQCTHPQNPQGTSVEVLPMYSSGTSAEAGSTRGTPSAQPLGSAGQIHRSMEARNNHESKSSIYLFLTCVIGNAHCWSVNWSIGGPLWDPGCYNCQCTAMAPTSQLPDLACLLK